MLLLSCLSIPATIIVSELTYRYIELPGIKIGRRAAAWMQPPIASGVTSQWTSHAKIRSLRINE
ncbi:hypothetical protein EAS61_23510 [Bradyrhizobium zhanjiangense]|uniref:Uncharacterized protein n=1 Tax=Bradyrhizobium zhanjiangense TaxID=1325107 RepID=A0A4Q0QIC6_9BRAD|nr:hypothetical protein EAS61_23510 [Bradyrhizobium zhanjiangense]